MSSGSVVCIRSWLWHQGAEKLFASCLLGEKGPVWCGRVMLGSTETCCGSHQHTPTVISCSPYRQGTLHSPLFLALLTQLIFSGVLQGYLCFSLYLAAKLFFSDWLLLMKNKSIYPHQLHYKYRENRLKMSPHGDAFAFFHS